MSSISKYAILGVGFAFTSLQAVENPFVSQEAATVDQSSANPSESQNSQQVELISVENAGGANMQPQEVPAPSDPMNPSPIVSATPQEVSPNPDAPQDIQAVQNAEQSQEPEKNYRQEEVLDDMLSIGAYDSVVNDMKQQQPKSASTAVKVEDFVGPINIDADSPCDKIVAIPDWDRYSGDSAKTWKGWKRWWSYLNQKEPIMMQWVDGLVIRIYPKNEIYRSIFVNGIYDPNMVTVAERFLPKNGVMIEAGANMGYFSMLISKYLGSEGKVYALEPSKRDFQRLVDNVSMNKLSKFISCHNLAVLERNSIEKLMVAYEERSALNTFGSAFSFKGVEKLAEFDTVQTITLDEFAKNEGLERVDVLKLDIEGSELRALHGGKNFVERFRPAIILGVNRNALAASEKLPDGLKKKEKEQMEKQIVNRIYHEIQQTLGNMRYKMYKLVTSPKFELQPVENLEKAHLNIVYCLHESIVPPEFEQPKQVSIFEKIANFFAD